MNNQITSTESQDLRKSLQLAKNAALKLYNNYVSIYNKMTTLSAMDLNEMYKTYQTLTNKNFTCVYFIRNKY